MPLIQPVPYENKLQHFENKIIFLLRKLEKLSEEVQHIEISLHCLGIEPVCISKEIIQELERQLENFKIDLVKCFNFNNDLTEDILNFKREKKNELFIQINTLKERIETLVNKNKYYAAQKKGIEEDKDKNAWRYYVNQSYNLFKLQNDVNTLSEGREELEKVISYFRSRNNELQEEVCVLREELCSLAEVDSQKCSIIDKFQNASVETRLKTQEEMKLELMQELDTIKMQNCRQVKVIAVHRDQLDLYQKKIRVDAGLLSSMKNYEKKLQDQMDRVKFNNHEISEEFRSKLMHFDLECKHNNQTLVEILRHNSLRERLIPQTPRQDQMHEAATSIYSKALSSGTVETEKSKSVQNERISQIKNLGNELDNYNSECHRYSALCDATETKKCRLLDLIKKNTKELKHKTTDLIEAQYSLSDMKNELEVVKKMNCPTGITEKKSSDDPISKILDRNELKTMFDILQMENNLLKGIILQLPSCEKDALKFYKHYGFENKQRFLSSCEYAAKFEDTN